MVNIKLNGIISCNNFLYQPGLFTFEMIMITITRSVLFILIVGCYASCTKVDVPKDTPRKVKKVIKEAIKEGCLTYVVKMNTDIGTLYMLQKFNCLTDKLLYIDEKGEQVCFTDRPPHSCKNQAVFTVKSKETIWDWRD